MVIEPLMSDAAILQELGTRLARQRVEAGLTQAELAEQTGVAKRTVERLEAGESTQTSTLVRILRGLGLLESFNAVIPLAGPSPLALLKSKGRVRQRASAKQKRPATDRPWNWGEDA